MISSQKKDGVFTFSMQANPLLSTIVDNNWRKESFKDINIFIPENVKMSQFNDFQQSQDSNKQKFQIEKPKEWNDIGLHDLLGKYTDLKDLDKKEKLHL